MLISEKLVFMTWLAKGTGVSFIMRPCREHVDGHGASNQLAGIVTPQVAGTFVMMGWIVKGNPVFCGSCGDDVAAWPAQIPKKLQDFLDKASAQTNNDDHWQ